MRRFGVLISMVVGVSFLLGGCVGMYYQEPEQPRTIYTATDATALVYSDPDMAATVDDNPVRWLGFLLHPVGLGLDYALNRPFYRLAGQSPGFFGYTAEDAQLDAFRGGVSTP